MTDEAGTAFHDSTLAELSELCIRSALEALRFALNRGLKPKRATHFVRIQREPNGKRTKTTDDPPLDYGTLLKEEQSSWEPGVLYRELDGYEALTAYLRSVPEYWTYLSAEDRLASHGNPETWFHISVGCFISDLVDRHIHVCGWDFDEAHFRTHYGQLERGLRAAAPGGLELTVDVLVPLCGVTFDVGLDGLGARIEPLDDGQLAACWPHHRLEAADEKLILSATHMWVQPSVPVTRDPLGWLDPAGLDFDMLDRLLQVMSISTSKPFGTKHVLYRPNGWAESWTGSLPAGGSWTWTYDRLVNGLGRSGPLDQPTSLQQAVVQRRLGELVTASNELQLAARRLLSASCRQDPIDAVIDACIGIEALAGDEAPNDITYKLAIRTAAVLAQAGCTDTKDIFNTVKKLYARRSKIVHGKLKPGDKNVVNAMGGQYSAASIGSVMLRVLLGTVLDRPDLADRISNDDLVLSLLSHGESRPPDAPQK